ncbi:MAG TPA: hypothetical protein VF388_09170, partial [Lacunisphaera sp.]
MTTEPNAKAVGSRPSSLPGWLVAAGIALIAVAGMIFVRGGAIHPESYHTYLPHYLGDAPFLQKIFDVNVTDAGNYQARELSYVFDWIDCHFIDFCVGLGAPHFLSLTYYVFSALLSVAIWRFGVHDLGLDRWIVALLLALYWTAPQVVLSGFCYRSAKVGTMLMICLFVWLCHRQLAAPTQAMTSGQRVRTWILAYLLLVLGTLFDRQGFYLEAVAAGILFFWFCAYRGTMALGLAVAAAAAFVTSHLYNVWLCPMIIYELLGYDPDFTFQGTSLAASELLNPVVIKGAYGLLVDNARYFLGNVSGFVLQLGVVAVAVTLFLAARRHAVYEARRPRLAPWLALVIFFGVLGAIFLMNEFMVMKFSPVLWDDLRRVYYWSPTVGLFLFGATLIIGWIGRAGLLKVRLTRMLLLAMLLNNIAVLPEHYRYYAGGQLSGWIASKPALLRALRHLDDPSKGAPK